ncbi:MAG: hypothetical protein DMG98_16275, partial [Acidobacteria bacterium]
VVRADRPLVTQIVMALSSAARLAGELAGFVPYLCGRHSSAYFSTNSPCSSPRIAAPPKYEPKFKRWELANVIGRMGQFCGTNVLSQIDDATQAQSAGIERSGWTTPARFGASPLDNFRNHWRLLAIACISPST